MTDNRKLTQRGRDRRHQLMEYAAQRFADGGYHPTSVADIVDGLQVGKGVFYWYFSSKEELLLEILREGQLELRRAQRDAIEGIENPLERIEAGIRCSIEWLANNRQYVTLIQFAATEERFAPHLARGADVAVADLVRHVKDGIADGSFADGDPVVISHAILGVTNHLARTFVLRQGDHAKDVADAAVAFCLGGLRGAMVATP
jgi:AcrR family transcriptional regulator